MHAQPKTLSLHFPLQRRSISIHCTDWTWHTQDHTHASGDYKHITHWTSDLQIKAQSEVRSRAQRGQTTIYACRPQIVTLGDCSRIFHLELSFRLTVPCHLCKWKWTLCWGMHMCAFAHHVIYSVDGWWVGWCLRTLFSLPDVRSSTYNICLDCSSIFPSLTGDQKLYFSASSNYMYYQE